MSRRVRSLWAVLLSTTLALSGCHPTQPFFLHEDGDLSHYVDVATDIVVPDADALKLPDVECARPPFTLDNTDAPEMWDLTLEEAVKTTMANSKVMRSLAGRYSSAAFNARAQTGEAPDAIITNADASHTVYDPAITETTPLAGVEYALSAFDAQLSSSFAFQKNDHPQNVTPAVAGFNSATIFQENNATWNTQISKTTATGGTLTVSQNTTYEQNNSAANAVPTDWNVNYQVSFSQPLLQGAGAQFNRIAGPQNPFTGTGTPQFDGVLLARISTDISLADFEISVRNTVRDVEDSYWELYFAYRNLEASKTGLNSALQTWRKVHALYVASAIGGEAEKEAQARQQYFIFRGTVQTALNDLYRAENRVRYIMGLSVTDGRLIRPKDEPSTARVTFDWHEIHEEGLARSVELRRQKWRLKERELELIAAKNLLLPRLDVNGTYRWLGLGNDLIGGASSLSNGLPGTGAYNVLGTGAYEEWQAGFNFTVPLGFRQANSTVRYYQLNLARERARLQDEEIELSHELGDAVRNLDYNYDLMLSNLNRRIAAEREVDAVTAAYEAGKVTFDLLLNAQQRRADAESAYYRNLADYARGILQVHYRKGSLLEYNGIYLTEGPWPAKAQFDAHQLARQRDASYYLNYGYTRPHVVSQGPYRQMTGDGGVNGQIPGPGGNPQAAPPEEVPTPAPVGGSYPTTSRMRPTQSDPTQPNFNNPNGPAINQPGEHQAGLQQPPNGGRFAWGGLGLGKPAEDAKRTTDATAKAADGKPVAGTPSVPERVSRTESRLLARDPTQRDDASKPTTAASNTAVDPRSGNAPIDAAARARSSSDEWKETSYESLADPSAGATDWISPGWQGTKR
jgi:outer membrane protein TolC